MSYLTLSSQEKHLFYSVRTFTHIRQHYFSKYWGDQCMAVPHLKFWGGPSPQFPLGLRRWVIPAARASVRLGIRVTVYGVNRRDIVVFEADSTFGISTKGKKLCYRNFE